MVVAIDPMNAVFTCHTFRATGVEWVGYNIGDPAIRSDDTATSNIILRLAFTKDHISTGLLSARSARSASQFKISTSHTLLASNTSTFQHTHPINVRKWSTMGMARPPQVVSEPTAMAPPTPLLLPWIRKRERS